VQWQIPGGRAYVERKFTRDLSLVAWGGRLRFRPYTARKHADESITDTYSFQDENTIRAAVEGAGLGFNLA
jgi:hypothetical protein